MTTESLGPVIWGSDGAEATTEAAATRTDWEQALLADQGLPHRAAQKPTAVSSEGMLMAEAL